VGNVRPTNCKQPLFLPVGRMSWTTDQRFTAVALSVAKASVSGAKARSTIPRAQLAAAKHSACGQDQTMSW